MTTSIKEHATYIAGPYKGYCGYAEYDSDADLFHGELVGTKDVVTFQGRTVEELRTALRESVDDYLAFCAERGEKPNKPYSGKLVVRLPPETHRRLAVLAKAQGKSLNTVISECLDTVAADSIGKQRQPPRRADTKTTATRRK